MLLVQDLDIPHDNLMEIIQSILLVGELIFQLPLPLLTNKFHVSDYVLLYQNNLPFDLEYHLHLSQLLIRCELYSNLSLIHI